MRVHSKGVVDVKQGKGMRVAPSSEWDPLDTDIMRIRFERGDLASTWREMIEARRMFEVEAAGLAAERRDESDQVALAKSVERMSDAARSGDLEAYRRADAEFHLCVIRATHNAVLQRIVEPIYPVLVAGGLRPARDPLCSLKPHEQVLKAIQAQDPITAREAMRESLTISDRIEAEMAAFRITLD